MRVFPRIDCAPAGPSKGGTVVREMYGPGRDWLMQGAVGIVSAPLWNSKTSTFAGLLTSSDYINVIQYYWEFPEKVDEIENFTLESLRGTPYHLRC